MAPPRRNPANIPNTGLTPQTQLRFSTPELAFLRSLTPSHTITAGIRLLIAQEHLRRLAKRPKPLPPPAPCPALALTPPTTHQLKQNTVRLTRAELTHLEAIVTHQRETEGIYLDTNSTLRRLIHDQQRRQPKS